MSYSLYLRQQLFLWRYHTSWFTTFPVSVGLAVTGAIASYHLVERPFLRLRERLEARLCPPRVQAVAADRAPVDPSSR